MTKEITTEGLQTKFLDIIKKYHYFVNEFNLGENNAVLKLILAKILTNLSSGNLLWSKGLCNDAFIVLRSAFNSFILFEYLVSFPREVETFKTDSEIAEFKNLFGYYERGFLTIEQLSEFYLALGSKTKEKIKINIDSKTNILNFKLDKIKKTLENHKSITQKMHKMGEKLKEINKPNFEQIENFWLHSWNINSQIAHGEFYNLMNVFTEREKNQELLDEIKECFRQSMGIIVYSVESINSLLKNEKDKTNFKQAVWDKIILFYEYIGSDISKFKKQEIKESDLIEIVKIPIFIPFDGQISTSG